MGDDQVTIETPEHVQFSYELAGLGSRGLASFVDHLLFGTGFVVLTVALALLGTALDLPDVTWIGWALGASFVLFYVLYFILAEGLTGGRSPGKRLVGIRVIRDDGTAATALDMVVRNALRLVDMLPAFYSVGLIAMLVHRRSKRVGDMAARTIVVKERLLELSDIAPTGSSSGEPLPPSPLHSIARLGVRRVTAEEVRTIQRYLERRHELEAPRAAEIAGRLFQSLAPRFPAEHQQAIQGDPEGFLQALAEVYMAEIGRF